MTVEGRAYWAERIGRPIEPGPVGLMQAALEVQSALQETEVCLYCAGLCSLDKDLILAIWEAKETANEVALRSAGLVVDG